MQNLLQEEPDQYINHLLEQQPYFQNDLSIINFIQKDSPVINKKIGICAWNDRVYENAQISQRKVMSSPKIQSQKNRIQDFLATIKNKNGEFGGARGLFSNKIKKSSLDSYDSQKPQMFLPLSNTIIAFPKSRSQSRKIQGEQRIILEKLYRKRQKSKVIPKQIFINPSGIYGTSQGKFPVKNYLAKNRSFIDQRSPKKIYNPQEKSILAKMRRRFPNSYYKKTAGIFPFQEENERSLIEKNERIYLSDKDNETFLKSLRKIKSRNEQLQKSPISKMYKTIQANAKFHNINLGCQRELSISKVKQQAKNTHLNRMKIVEKNEIQLLGSTISKWKNEASKKLHGNQ